MRIIIVGFGTVGQGFAQILRDKGAELARKFNFHPNIVGVATRSKGMVYHPNGLQIDALLGAMEHGNLSHYPDSVGLVRDWSTDDLIRKANADLMVEVSVSDLQTGQPATEYCLNALKTRKHVVVANKGVVALHYQQVQRAAQEVQKDFRYEGTVMAGTPSIALALESLSAANITGAKGILNGTTNYMLTQMENGMSYAEALAQAQALGYAEADPTADVGGWDAAGKALILANAVFGGNLQMSDLHVDGITQLTPELIAQARSEGECYKLIAEVTAQGGSIKPTRIPLSHPLAGVKGATNAITYSTELLGDVTLVGAGAGKLQTGYAILADILAIHRQ
jgi:homoserine dehydrogenase